MQALPHTLLAFLVDGLVHAIVPCSSESCYLTPDIFNKTEKIDVTDKGIGLHLLGFLYSSKMAPVTFHLSPDPSVLHGI